MGGDDGFCRERVRAFVTRERCVCRHRCAPPAMSTKTTPTEHAHPPTPRTGKFEGNNISVLEAMACGCLVVGFTGAGGADFITEKTSVLVENGGPMKRQEIIKAVLRKRDIRLGTISLNLQKYPFFKRVGRAVYEYDPSLEMPRKKRGRKPKNPRPEDLV